MNSTQVVDHLSRFTEWCAYEHRVLANLDRNLYPVPINQDTINRLYGLNLDEKGVAAYWRASVASRRTPTIYAKPQHSEAFSP